MALKGKNFMSITVCSCLAVQTHVIATGFQNIASIDDWPGLPPCCHNLYVVRKVQSLDPHKHGGQSLV